MRQLGYRVAELDRLQTDPDSSSSNQPKTTELQLHQEIQQLMHQLQHTQLHIHDVIHQHVQATKTPHTAQLNALTEGLQQVHLIAQNAHAAVAHTLAATLQDTALSTAGPELPRATAPVTADISMDPEAYNHHLGNPLNPGVPPYTGAQDPGLWLLQVQALFQAHRTPASQ